MIEFGNPTSARDLPTPDESEVSVLAHPMHAPGFSIVPLSADDEDQSGMRWLLERPEALVDLRAYETARFRRRSRRASKEGSVR